MVAVTTLTQRIVTPMEDSRHSLQPQTETVEEGSQSEHVEKIKGGVDKTQTVWLKKEK